MLLVQGKVIFFATYSPAARAASYIISSRQTAQYDVFAISVPPFVPRIFPRPRQGHTRVPASATSMSVARICISPCHGRAHVPGRDSPQKSPWQGQSAKKSPARTICKTTPHQPDNDTQRTICYFKLSLSPISKSVYRLLQTFPIVGSGKAFFHLMKCIEM